ncbi:MAG: hypothetical protein LC791_05330, partial [Acidobacteria bacterium]|nr:hypothetical protein [Acidobacteriota bacterium]
MSTPRVPMPGADDATARWSPGRGATMTVEHAGQFARAYRAGVTEQLEPSARGARAVPTDAVTPRAAPMRPIALRGAVITPTAAWTDGYVVVDGGIVADVRRAKPDGVRVIDT